MDTISPLSLVSIPNAQHRLGDIGRTTVYGLINEGLLVKVSIGTRSFITSASIDAYLARITAEASESA